MDFSEARSFSGIKPPNQAQEVHQERKGNTVFYYYIDEEGNTYYETDRGYRFKQQIEELKKQKRR